jgi:hypothetical protein
MNKITEADLGQHVFERSGLGNAPYRLVDVYSDVGPKKSFIGGVTVEVGYPGQSMGRCDHCGTAIGTCYKIKSSDGKSFVVGSSCVEKSGDTGLIKSVKNSPEARAMTASKRDALNDRKSAELSSLLIAHADQLSSIKITRYDGSEESQLDYLTRVIPMCGAAGRARYLKHLKTIVASN